MKTATTMNDLIENQLSDYEEIGNEIDLFEYSETLPQDVQIILDEYCLDDHSYENCANLVKELEAVGYTCDYGLDAVPYGLKKL